MTNTLTKKELSKYLGPSVVSAADYQSYMWRIENEKGKSSIIKCNRENNCIHYYMDENGVEHRDGIFNIEQLPVAYRSMKYLLDATDGINTNTKLSYALVCLLFGEPEVDSEIPFVYRWNRGDYVLESTGNNFSVNRLGEDTRESVKIVGNLPLPYRQVLDTQKVSTDLTTVDDSNVETVAYANELSAIEEFVPESETLETYNINGNDNKDDHTKLDTQIEVSTEKELTLLDLSSKDVELLLENIGSSTIGEEELEEQFKSSVTLAAEAKEQAYEETTFSDRKQMTSVQEPATIPEAPEGFLDEVLKVDVTEVSDTEKVTEKSEPVVKASKKLGRPKKQK